MGMGTLIVIGKELIEITVIELEGRMDEKGVLDVREEDTVENADDR